MMVIEPTMPFVPLASVVNTATPRHPIELRLHGIEQLFNSMDPTPFHHKDLDPDAEQFIESWALEFPPNSRFDITIHLETLPSSGDPTTVVTTAINNYFDYKAELTRRDRRQLLLTGRTSLLIGMCFLTLCLLLADWLTHLATGTFLTILRESLTIGGWVAMWKPMQIFLYEWWPLTRRERVYRHLADARIQVVT